MVVFRASGAEGSGTSLRNQAEVVELVDTLS